jgi:hypothetical protein
MINANELRYGNLLLIKGNNIEDCNDDYGKLRQDEYVKVLEIYEKGVSVSDLEETQDEIELFTDRIKPIPLTEEILLKCGFVRSLNWGYDKIYTKEIRLWEDDNILKIDYYIINEKHYFTTSICLLEHEYLYNCNKLENLKEENIDKEVTIQDFDYVHQLQNLYFTLTNKELQIEL